MKIFYFIISFAVLSCSYPGNSRNVKPNDSALSSNDRDSIDPFPPDSVSENPDQTFEIFLARFNADSLFQVSRIVFPLKGEVLDMNLDSLIVETTDRSHFTKYDFTYDVRKANPLTDNYRRDISISGNKAKIIYTGIENGIDVMYFFEKRDGKWMLVYYLDQST